MKIIHLAELCTILAVFCFKECRTKDETFPFVVSLVTSDTEEICNAALVSVRSIIAPARCDYRYSWGHIIGAVIRLTNEILIIENVLYDKDYRDEHPNPFAIITVREAVNRDYIMNNGNKIDLLAADFDTSNCILKTIRWNKASIKTLLYEKEFVKVHVNAHHRDGNGLIYVPSQLSPEDLKMTITREDMLGTLLFMGTFLMGISTKTIAIDSGSESAVYDVFVPVTRDTKFTFRLSRIR